LQLEVSLVLINAVTLFPSIGRVFNEDSSRYIAAVQSNIAVATISPRLL
jgi:hypothetical protein